MWECITATKDNVEAQKLWTRLFKKGKKQIQVAAVSEGEWATAWISAWCWTELATSSRLRLLFHQGEEQAASDDTNPARNSSSEISTYIHCDFLSWCEWNMWWRPNDQADNYDKEKKKFDNSCVASNTASCSFRNWLQSRSSDAQSG